VQTLSFIREMSLNRHEGGGASAKCAELTPRCRAGTLACCHRWDRKGASSGVWRADVKKESVLPKENDLEGQQDQGGKHGGQAGMPKSPERPKKTDRDEDVARKGTKQD
jgi:hypothetical protein